MEDGHHTCNYNSNEHKMSLIIAEILRFLDSKKVFKISKMLSIYRQNCQEINQEWVFMFYYLQNNFLRKLMVDFSLKTVD